jgi:outer membrane protein assembly factor BamB
VEGAWPLTKSFQRLSSDRFHVLEPVFARLPGTAWNALILFSAGTIEARNPVTGAALWARPIPCRNEPQFLGLATGRFILATGQRIFAISRESGTFAWSFGEEPADRPMEDPESILTWTCYAMTASRIFAASDRGDVLAIDAASGGVVWRNATHLQITHLCADDRHVCLAAIEGRKSHLRFVDAMSGRVSSQWAPQEAAPVEIVSMLDDGTFISLFSQRISALDPERGAERFIVRTADRFVPATLDCQGGGIIVSPDGKRLCKYDRNTGRLIWQTEVLPANAVDGLWVQVSEPNVFVASGDSIWSFRAADGQRLWKATIRDRLHSLTPKLADQMVFVMAGSGDLTDERRRLRLIALSRKDGVQMQVSKNESIVTEPLKPLDGFYVRDGSVILVTGNQMIGYSAER